MAECQYDFNHRERGFAIVIVNKNFPAGCGLKKRGGWKKDMTRMRTFFKSLDFRVKCYKDLSSANMIEKIHKGKHIIRLAPVLKTILSYHILVASLTLMVLF